MCSPGERGGGGGAGGGRAGPGGGGGKGTGALGASYIVGALNQMLFNDIYDGIGFSMIIDTSGKIISCDSGLSYRKIGINDNVYDFYTKSGEVAEKTMKSAKANIKKQKSGILVL